VKEVPSRDRLEGLSDISGDAHVVRARSRFIPQPSRDPRARITNRSWASLGEPKSQNTSRGMVPGAGIAQIFADQRLTEKLDTQISHYIPMLIPLPVQRVGGPCRNRLWQARSSQTRPSVLCSVRASGYATTIQMRSLGADFQTASLAAFTGRALTIFRAGFALNTVGSLVKGLMPLRSLVAGFLMTTNLANPGSMNTPAFFSSLWPTVTSASITPLTSFFDKPSCCSVIFSIS